MVDLALQTPAQEPIRKLIVFTFWAQLVRGPPSGSANIMAITNPQAKPEQLKLS
jgi:hypothetical protein